VANLLGCTSLFGVGPWIDDASQGVFKQKPVKVQLEVANLLGCTSLFGVGPGIDAARQGALQAETSVNEYKMYYKFLTWNCALSFFTFDRPHKFRISSSNFTASDKRLPRYATETSVSEGIQGTEFNDDEYDFEGEDIESFGHLFGWSPEPAIGQTVKRSSRKSNLLIKYKIIINKIHEPATYLEAVKDSKWIEAMNQEIESLNRNNTWEITDLPTGRKPIGSKWVFKVKYKASGDVGRFKARLVAKCFNQREGIAYEETFSLVVKIVLVRCVLSLAIKNKWSLFELNTNNAFLYGDLDLDDNVYMSLPEGYSDVNKKKVCKIVLIWIETSPKEIE
ncbi:putative RNA-directed DNA polymerase, partial [Tanacetum coccineum]